MKKLIVIIFGIIVLMGACINSTSDDVSNTSEEQVENTNDNNVSSDSTSVNDITKTWEYSEENDDMDDSKNFWYSLQSDNYANFDFPYEGNSYLTITVRYMKKWGYDVILRIDKGQMVGNEINGTNYVRVRFDDGKVEKYYYDTPADYSSDNVFIRNKSKFIKKCKKAKTIIIEQEFYREGCHQFKFHVDKSLVIK